MRQKKSSLSHFPTCCGTRNCGTGFFSAKCSSPLCSLFFCNFFLLLSPETEIFARFNHLGPIGRPQFVTPQMSRREVVAIVRRGRHCQGSCNENMNHQGGGVGRWGEEKIRKKVKFYPCDGPLFSSMSWSGPFLPDQTGSLSRRDTSDILCKVITCLILYFFFSRTCTRRWLKMPTPIYVGGIKQS